MSHKAKDSRTYSHKESRGEYAARQARNSNRQVVNAVAAFSGTSRRQARKNIREVEAIAIVAAILLGS